MKFNVASKALYSTLSGVSKVINAKNTISILDNFLLKVVDDSLEITASDSENTLSARLPIKNVEGKGRFCLNARRITDMAKELPDVDVEFEINDNTLATKISFPGGNFDIVALDGDQYPETIETTSAEESLKMVCPATQILNGVENTLFAVGTDEIRPQMMGILWDIKEDGITFVATDTRKLVKFTNSLVQPQCECSFILPLKPATVLKNVFAKEDSIKVTVSERNVRFESSSYIFDCRLIKGNFPPYERVIPAGNPYTLTIDRQSLINSLRRVCVFGDDGNGLVKFKLSADNLTLRAQDSSYGTSGLESLPCQYDGAELLIGFGAPYLLEIFNTLSTPDVMMKLADPSHAAICLPAENAPGTELLMLLMPMHIVD